VNLTRPNQPAYAGIVTFSQVPLVLDPAELGGADVVVVGAPIDETTVVRPGTRYGPRGIRTAGYGAGLPNMDLGVSPFEELTVLDHGDAPVVPADAAKSHEAIRRTVSDIMSVGAIPVVLGGDHSIAHPDVGAVAEALRPAEVGLIHFDAHADDAKDLYGWSGPTARQCGCWSRKAPSRERTSCRWACAVTGPVRKSSSGPAARASGGT
jgi:agmatinase